MTRIPILGRVAVAGLLVLAATTGFGGKPRPETILLQKKGLVISSERDLNGQDYELLGRVGTSCHVVSITESDPDRARRCSGSLVSPALALGASAILGLHVVPTPVTTVDKTSLFQGRISGVAVRAQTLGQATPRRRVAFVIAVLPTEVPDSLVRNARVREELSRLMQEVAMASAEDRGYYAERAEPVAADSGSLASMSDPAWTRAFGPWAGAVLSTRLVVSGTSSVLGERKKQEMTVEAALFSRDSTRVIWSRTAGGQAATWGVLQNVVFEDLWDMAGTKALRLHASLGEAIHNAIEGMPPVQ